MDIIKYFEKYSKEETPIISEDVFLTNGFNKIYIDEIKDYKNYHMLYFRNIIIENINDMFNTKFLWIYGRTEQETIKVTQENYDIRFFSCVHSKNLKTIVGLERIMNLTILDISKTNIDSLLAIGKNSTLDTLLITKNRIKNLMGIQNFPRLKTVYMIDNEINNIDDLSEMKYLRNINIINNKVQEIDFRSTNPNFYSNIQTFEAEKNQLSDISFLKRFSNNLRVINLKNQTICIPIIQKDNSYISYINIKGISGEYIQLLEIPEAADLYNKNIIIWKSERIKQYLNEGIKQFGTASFEYEIKNFDMSLGVFSGKIKFVLLRE